MTVRQKAKQDIEADIQEYYNDVELDWQEFQDLFWGVFGWDDDDWDWEDDDD